MTFQLNLDDGHQVARPLLTPPMHGAHKYERGHALVISGPALKTGASRLSAQAALAVGAGLVTLIGDRAALAEQAAHITAVMLGIDDDELSYLDDRVHAIAVGPGAGATPELERKVLKLLKVAATVVLDADALTVFEHNNMLLFNNLRSFDVMTPHLGEFGRIFPDLEMLPPVEVAVAAAQRSGCVVLLKGADTVIASNTGQWAINSHSSSWLATAGSGDVLTGLICGLLAQGVPSFDAAAIGAWLHGDIGLRAGPGLTADAMLGYIPLVLKGCLQEEGAKGE